MLFVALEKRMLSNGECIYHIQNGIWSNDGINGNRPRPYRMRLSKSITQRIAIIANTIVSFFIEYRRYVKIQLDTVVKVYETVVARRHKKQEEVVIIGKL